MVTVLVLISLLFGRVLAWSMAVTLAIVLGRRPFSWWTLAILIVVGILEDITVVRPLGGSSLVLLGLALSVWFAENQYRSMILFWSFGMGLLGEILLHFVLGQPLTWTALVAQVVALAVIGMIQQRFDTPEGIYVGK